jgi:transcription elongation factor GreB
VSKAFTKEESAEPPLVLPRRAPLPEGVPNYVTAAGLAAYRDELSALKRERAALGTAAGAEDAVRGEQAALAARIAELEARLASAELVDTRELSRHEVRFGAQVTVRTAAGDDKNYQIVGVDEANAAEGRLGFVSPLARALLGQRVGAVVTVRTPHGDDEIELIAIDYD